MRQQIRFCTAEDGVRIAYAIHGGGAPLVRAATWMTHLQHDWDSPLWKHWLEGLASGRTVVRYDERGCGLSDRDVPELSLDRSVADLEAVVDATGLEQFALLGTSQGGPTAVAYAVRHPERVSKLVLYGSYARGRLRRGSESARRELEAMLALIAAGWGQDNPAFRRVFTTLFVPDATAEQERWFDELQRLSTAPEMAVRIRRSRDEIDISDLAPRVRTPTLILHARGDAAVPFQEGRLLATLIPSARFVPLEGRNHILLANEPAWPRFLQELDGFLGSTSVSTHVRPALSPREASVLRLAAEGLSNEAIAARLFLSERTIERHLANIYVKFGVAGRGARAAAVARFFRALAP
ncbi:MAG TPA: alpha/beta fold hydrolase [Chloroflexota bacterium]|nr:alpha/beta fold hydrolase [Chloroflexota bacterium]